MAQRYSKFIIETKYQDLPSQYGINREAYLNCGWKGENNTNIEFNKSIYQLINIFPLQVLELGCGGGGVVKQFLDDGHIAFGIDAQPAYEANKEHCWAIIPDNLYRCDIGKPFYIYYEDKPIKFDLIHSWECLEHIYEPDTDQLMENINQHSNINTYFIGSFSQRPEEGHRNLHNKDWWLQKFETIGFYEVDINFGRNVIRDISDSTYLYLRKVWNKQVQNFY